MISSTFLSITLVLCLGNILHGDGSRYSRSLEESASAVDARLLSAISGRASLWDCSSDSDCTTEDSTCVDGYCECSSGYMFSADFTSCLRIATAYGDECAQDLQCSSYLLTGAVCEDAICVCGDGYHYIRGRCWPTSGLGEECAADVNCYVNADPEATSCVDGVCVCSDGFYQREYRTCRRAGYAVGDECAIDLDCKFENAYCDTSTYRCAEPASDDAVTPESTTLASDGAEPTESTTIASGGAESTESTTIASDGAEPTESTTIASDGAEPTESTTIASGGAEPTESTTIASGGAESTESTTIASDGAEPTESTTIASGGAEPTESTTIASDDAETSNPTLIGDECTSNDDCAEISNSRCGASGTCSCNRATFASTDLTACIPELGEDCDANDPASISYAFCRDGIWSCGDARVFSTQNQICRKSTKYYDWSCLHDEQCYIFGPDSSCQNKRCLCNEGSHLVEEESFCWVSRGIGESCQADEDCYVDGLDVALSCSDYVCTCPNGTYANANGTACKLSNAVLGDSCEENADCTTTNAACVGSVCSCADHYYESGGACVAGIGTECTADSDCSVSNSTCSDEVCTCSDNYVEYTDEACAPVSTYNGECVTNLQCSTSLANTICDADENSPTRGTCICDSDYHYSYGACQYKHVIGDFCTSRADCYLESNVERVVCRSGVCACDYDYNAETSTTCGRSDATSFLLSTSLGLLTIVTKLCL